jgi:glyoxylase-like metal-dependent hydrolase (beta-lactamase superfamily II)
MSGRNLPGGDDRAWSGGVVHESAICVLAPNPSPWTLDGTNTWVIGTDTHAIVIDPGPLDDAHLDAIISAIDGRTHCATLLTHGHGDHSASAQQFFERTGVAVRALDPLHRFGGAGLQEADVINCGDLHVEVIATPGHSADSLCFVIPEHGLVATGDTVLGRGTTAIIWPEGRLDEYLASLDRLSQQYADTDLLLPGHGPVLNDPAAVFDHYITHRHERLDEVRAAYASGARTIDELVAAVYADVPSAVIPAATLSLRAQVAYLIENGELPSSVGD